AWASGAGAGAGSGVVVGRAGNGPKQTRRAGCASGADTSGAAALATGGSGTAGAGSAGTAGAGAGTAVATGGDSLAGVCAAVGSDAGMASSSPLLNRPPAQAPTSATAATAGNSHAGRCGFVAWPWRRIGVLRVGGTPRWRSASDFFRASRIEDMGSFYRLAGLWPVGWPQAGAARKQGGPQPPDREG